MEKTSHSSLSSHASHNHHTAWTLISAAVLFFDHVKKVGNNSIITQ